MDVKSRGVSSIRRERRPFGGASAGNRRYCQRRTSVRSPRPVTDLGSTPSLTDRRGEIHSNASPVTFKSCQSNPRPWTLCSTVSMPASTPFSGPVTPVRLRDPDSERRVYSHTNSVTFTVFQRYILSGRCTPNGMLNVPYLDSDRPRGHWSGGLRRHRGYSEGGSIPAFTSTERITSRGRFSDCDCSDAFVRRRPNSYAPPRIE